MQHLTEEQLVMHRYGEDDVGTGFSPSQSGLKPAPTLAEEHLRSCAACRAQYETIGRVLSLVSDAPIPERSETYGAEVWNRLRWKLGTPRRSSKRVWQPALAAAAMLALAFFAGQLWRDRQGPSSVATVQRQPASSPAEAGAPFATAEGTDRVLLLVVSDHLDSSERMLLELVNADPTKRFDTVDQQKRAEELVSSNRIYRQTAQLQGEKRIASVLADLEPILVELSNSSASLDQGELAEMQKRIESRGLLFKVRVVGAQVTSEEKTPPSGTNSL